LQLEWPEQMLWPFFSVSLNLFIPNEVAAKAATQWWNLLSQTAILGGAVAQRLRQREILT
jgi:hypothetical protein